MGRSSSPDHISFHSRCKPSTPIEIPKRRGSLVSPLISPVDQPRSPDLIFDMSPISPSPFNHTIPLSTSNKMNNHGPFIYNVPVYIPRHSNTGTCFSTSSRQRVMPSSTAAPISAVHRKVCQTKATHAENVNDGHDSSSQSERNASKETQLTTKITGFIPSIEHQLPMADHISKPVGRLSPPPRRSSYSSSPWILPGTGNIEDDIAYSHIEPSVFDFKRDLLRRIENRDASQFMSFHSCL